MNPQYRALVEKVDGFAQQALQRRRQDMACRAGCDGCCHLLLEVSPVEAEVVRAALKALPQTRQDSIRKRAEAADPAAPRCPMLDETGQCEVYEARPLVCRTQGLALSYPEGVIPPEAVSARAGEADVTWCPLNFTEAPPAAADVLDAERVDQMLALINHCHAEQTEGDPHERTPLVAIARGADVLTLDDGEHHG